VRRAAQLRYGPKSPRFLCVVGGEKYRFGTRLSPERSPLREWIAKVFGITGLFGDRANTGCICEGGDRPVISKTKRGTTNVVIFPG
jgi:hypothetical protein